MRTMRITLPLLMLLALGCPREPQSAVSPTSSPTPVAIPHVAGPQVGTMAPIPRDELIRDGEKHFKSLTQITFGGENAEAYWSFDGTHLVLQARGGDVECDQIYTLEVATGKLERVSSGKGRTTCAHYFPGDTELLYASTHAAGDACPPKPDYSRGYVWPLYADYDIYRANADGSNVRELIGGDGYDAEATICKDGSIVFTSTRDGDIEIYRANSDGSDVKRLTNEPGYDGGAFFSRDCSKIVWRASRFEGDALKDYKKLLTENLVRPSKLEIYVMDADGSNKKQVTHLGAAAFAPYFYPDGSRIIFASNHEDPKGRNFDLYAIDVDGQNLEAITREETFDSFPMFSPDGKYLVFSSNRGAAEPGETNVFIAQWQ